MLKRKNDFISEKYKTSNIYQNIWKAKEIWEKDVKDWMGASVWRVGRTVEDRKMFKCSIKAARSRNW